MSTTTAAAPTPRPAGRRDHDVPSSRNHAGWVEWAPGVAYLTTGFVNLHLIREAGAAPVLVDTGLPGTSAYTHRALERWLGSAPRPAAIVLTHGHFDHAGSARALAGAWDVPVYAHPLELPYLTGRSDYPPQDSTMGGAIAQLARVFPHSGVDLGARVHPLPGDGSVPGLPGWRWLHTPGHTHGHVSLFREGDRVLVAGDAVATMDLDSWTSQLTEHPELDRPPAPFTTDWEAARRSAALLAALEPAAIGAGHGIPVAGPGVAEELRLLAGRFPVPPRGRYVGRPARADERGVLEVPPPVPDPLPARLAAGAVLAAAGLALWRRGRGAR